MVTSSPATRPSLDRLKALAELPDLESQLQEATQLCTHSAQADMILKWLLDRLKKDASARGSLPAWDLLRLTLRLLSPGAVTRLLSANDFLDIIHTCLSETATSNELVLSVNATLSLLVEMSEGPRGASIKAILSTDEVKAGSFVGTWLEKVYRSVHRAPDPAQLLESQALLGPAIRIWALRKPHATEHSTFATHCLVPASRLLGFLRSREIHTPQKRKRIVVSGSAIIDCVRFLESVLAKHVFLPARTAILNPQIRSAKSQHSGQADALLAERLLPLRSAGDDLSNIRHVVPTLLDVALRCGQADTPKQQLRERPWIEAVFSALLECVSAIDHPEGRAVLTSMLQNERVSLSSPSISQYADSFALLPGNTYDWQQVAAVVEKGAEIYLHIDRAKAIFDGLSAANLDLVTNTATTDHQTAQMRQVWKDDIIVPIMKTYASHRRLPDFVDHWHTQLKRPWRDVPWCVWFDLDNNFGLLLDAMADTHVVELLQRFHQSAKGMRATTAHVKDPAATNDVQATVVVLQAMMSGLHDQDRVDMMHDQLGSLFEDLLGLPTEHVKMYRHIWALLRTVFEQWFPRWIKVVARSDVVAKGAELLQCDTLQNALRFSKFVRQASSPANGLQQATQFADIFVASLCNYFCRYDECHELAASTAATMVGEQQSTAVVLYADLLPLIINKSTANPLYHWIETATSSLKAGKPISEAVEYLDAIVAAAEDQSHSVVIEQIIRVSLSYCGNHNNDEKFSLEQRRIALRLLSNLQSDTLEVSQRERIIKILLTDAHLLEDGNLTVIVERLRVLVQHFEMTEAVVEIFAQPKVVRQLLSVGRDSMKAIAPYPEENDTTIFEPLERLLREIVRSLSASRDHERKREALLTLSAEAKQYIESHVSLGRLLSADLGRLIFVKVVLSEMEQAAGAALKAQLAYRTKETLSTCIDGLLNCLGENDLDFESTNREYLSFQCIDTVLSIPRRMLADLGLDQYPHSITAAVELTLGYAQEFLITSNDFPDAGIATILRCVQTASEESYFPVTWYNTGGSFAAIAEQLLSLDLQPLQRRIVLESFEHGLHKLTNPARLFTVDELSRRDSGMSTSALLLLQQAIPALLKEDFESPSSRDCQLATPQQVPWRLLQTILQVRNVRVQRQAVFCLIVVLRTKPFMATQFIIDTTLMIMQKAVKQTSFLLADVCNIITALLNGYRARVRLHLLVPLLQALITCHFQVARPAEHTNGVNNTLNAGHAYLLARVNQLVCNPRRLRKHPKASDLVDEARKAQAQIGQYVQYVLHHYCTQVLHGTLSEEVREALMPGLWAIMEAIEVNDADGTRVLATAMNNSERAILRNVYAGYTTGGKWKGG